MASNEEFIAVSTGKKIETLKIEILNQNAIEYDGHAEAADRFAPGNKVHITPQSDGSLKTVVSEEREAMQTEERKAAEHDRGMSR
ncbi:hypothetical protein GALL_393270 [mine drainage metagenome]|uniref:Uncharacterized protein n=1 Tax=mine drainage metagenome TaxID=410659 RepID=A0A1J5Q704_9ZZZZ